MERTSETAARDYYRIESALRFLEENHERQPSLEEAARSVGLSEFYFQRLFQRWVGISPKRFLQYLSKEHALAALRESRSVLDASFDSGLSSAGRLHDLLVACEAVTPGEYRSGGAGLTIEYGVHPSPFGRCFVATTPRGICFLAFLGAADEPRRFRDCEDEASALAQLRADWRNAGLRANADHTADLVQRIFAPRPKSSPAGAPEITLHIKGTNFQIKVWEALLRIPAGSVLAYEDLAARTGKPTAVRAVASAVASNPVSYLIPCHRVIRKMGVGHNYRWGATRKQILLATEAAGTHAT